MSPVSPQAKEKLTHLLWSLWNELGVAGVGRFHPEHLIDPEPLIVTTAWIGSSDPRLRDESIDWCCRYGRFVSGARLRNLVPRFPGAVAQPYGRYVATIAANSSERWGGSDAVPFRVRPSGKSHVERFESASTLKLRLRGLFGVGARAEILTRMLFDSREQLLASEIAGPAGFTRRNVAVELEALRLSGIVAVGSRGKRTSYFLNRAEDLERLINPLPLIFTPWTELFVIAVSGIEVLERLEKRGSERTRDLEMHKWLDEVRNEFGLARLPVPVARGESRAFERTSGWLLETIERLAHPILGGLLWQPWLRPRSPQPIANR